MNNYNNFSPMRGCKADSLKKLKKLKKQVVALRSEILKEILEITNSSGDGIVEKKGYSYLMTDEDRIICSVLSFEMSDDSVVAILEYSDSSEERSVPVTDLNAEDLLEIIIEMTE